MRFARCIAALLLVAALAAPVIAQSDEAFLPAAWDAFKEAETNTPSGAFYLGFVLGTLQGANDNSLALKHVPDDISIGDMVAIVGAYIDKHREEASFKKLSSAEIVIKAVLAKYPAPTETDHKL
jgi:hypothetical protein